jgi:hypothetical protein
LIEKIGKWREGGQDIQVSCLTKRKYTKTGETKNCLSFNTEVILDTRA